MSVNTIEIPAGLGLARPDPERLRQIVARALQVPTDQIVGVADIEVEKVAYDIGTPSTHALLRCRGTAALDDATTRPWSAFVKVLQSVWAWEFLDQIPEPFRADLANNLPWRAELDGYTPNMLRALPAGLRQPRLFGVVEIDEWHVALWVEDVEVSSAVWGLAMFARAARLLGRLAARRPVGCDTLIAPSEQSAQPGFVLRYYTGGRVRMGALPQLVDDALWAHPTVAAAVEATGEHALRADLVDASEHLDAWLDLLDALPQTYAHGDASPQNLLVPASEPGTFVIIDWGFNCPLAVGFDLGQRARRSGARRRVGGRRPARGAGRHRAGVSRGPRLRGLRREPRPSPHRLRGQPRRAQYVHRAAVRAPRGAGVGVCDGDVGRADPAHTVPARPLGHALRLTGLSEADPRVH